MMQYDADFAHFIVGDFGFQWKTAPELPKNYGGYSLYNKAKVTITDYDGDNPIDLLPIHKKMYPYNSKGRFANTTAGAE